MFNFRELNPTPQESAGSTVAQLLYNHYLLLVKREKITDVSENVL